MPRKATGTVQLCRDADGKAYYRARITLPDGNRIWMRVPDKYGYSEARAREWAAAKSEAARDGGVVLTRAGGTVTLAARLTCKQWHALYCAHRRELGQTSVRDSESRWRRWIGEHIDDKRMADVSRSDVEAIRDALDFAVREYKRHGKGAGRLRGKSAKNVWGELTSCFNEAVTSKRKELRVLESSPCVNVQPPEAGPSRSKTYPYPSEFLQIAACERVPLEWRRLHAVAAYTFARPGELRVLTWDDVDLDDGSISITKAWDNERGVVKATKTGETRHPPIEATLLPLLRAMREDAKGDGLVVPLLSAIDEDKCAEVTRAHFRLAGVKRPRLFADTSSERHVVFRSWRDAGITWSIIRGDGIEKVQRRAGHKQISTTQKYIIEAENRGASFGTPFPPIPAALIVHESSISVPTIPQANDNADDSACAGRDLNPYESYPTGT